MAYKAHKFAVDDLVLLKEISEDAVLDAIQKHYQHDEIYTYIGEVLVSVNPYKMIKGLYGPSTLGKYRNRMLYENPPHVYAVSDNCVRNMVQNRENQCVIISGESGAGKTEASKKIMEYIAAVSSKRADVEKVKQQILESNPLLEAFGNAKTVRNNNSSRFGKYFEIEFNYRGDPVGGRITEYLLEKSRVVRRHPEERSFHIFYQMLAAHPEKEALHLGSADSYKYLTASNVMKVSGIDDKTWYKETTTAMDVCGFTKLDKQHCFQLVAAVLTIGNLEFNDTEVAGQDNLATVKNESCLKTLCDILSVSMPDLENALTHRTISAAGETMHSTLTAEQAAYSRDSLASGIYQRLFQWIAAKINETMFESNPATVIGVLDIYGFEIFDNNSFEQLCINFVNEKLQQIFIELTLRKEQEEYVAEGIEWTPVEYYDNKPCCDMIEKRGGIFDLLDEECLFPKGTDQSFLNKLRGNVKHDRFIPQGATPEKFGIHHFAGDVEYGTEKILDKNKDQLYINLIELMHSKCGVILANELFENDAEVAKGPSKRPLTAGFQFKNQVSSLMDALKACVPHYVRCIKPNEKKAANTFDTDRSREQVKYLGLVENVRVRRAGFAFRMAYVHFMQRFKMCDTATWPQYSGSDKEGCELIMSKIKQAGPVQYGKTKVFIKDPQTVLELEEKRAAALDMVVRKIQKAWRAFALRRFWLLVRAVSQDVLKDHKARRQWSLNRKYHGDYINMRKEKFSKAILSKNQDIQVLFADRVVKLRGAGHTQVSRGLMITDKAIYSLSLNGKATSGSVKRRIPFSDITGVSLSKLADNYIVFHARPYDLAVIATRKTEAAVALNEIFKEKMSGSTLKIDFSNSLSITLKGGKATTLTFEPSSEGTEDPRPAKTATGSFVVHVKSGLPPGIAPKATYLPPEKRRTTRRDQAPHAVDQAPVKRRQSGFAPAHRRASRRTSWGPNKAECIEDYEATREGELSLKKGDIIIVKEKNLDGWWHGTCNDVEGDFPATCVRTTPTK